MTKQTQKDFDIRYNQSDIKYITQFLVSPGSEEVLLELSPGLLKDSSDRDTLPIQARLALPWSTTERLANVLNQVVAARRQQIEEKLKAHQNQPVAPAGKPSNLKPSRGVPKASLPNMSSSSH
jgi:hypothetical protein